MQDTKSNDNNTTPVYISETKLTNTNSDSTKHINTSEQTSHLANNDVIRSNHSYTSRNSEDHHTSMNDQNSLKMQHDIKNIPDSNFKTDEMKKFHKSMQMTISQCNICKEAWPAKQGQKHKDSSNHICYRCKRRQRYSKEIQ